DVAAVNAASVEPPRQTFDKSPFVLEDSTRRVEFHFFGWAHTRGDGFVYLPKEQVICTGDAVTNGPYNYTADANIGNWPNVARAAQKLKVAHVLPGHGVPGGKEVLAGEERFMVELHKAVKSAIASGKKLDDLVEMKNGEPSKAKLQLPASVKHWVGEFLAAQVRDTYEEIAQNKPRGEILGGK
ncbi:MAG: MBL fold metallo-hydrolase, partial [Bryobacteraceae bacterium]